MLDVPQLREARQRLDWYQQAKFGLFIHWGAYTVKGMEASWPIMAPGLSAAMFGTSASIKEKEYITLPERFNPARFDADAWVRLAQAAGMRYIIITSKHHDGFCMFDAPGTDYKITKTPFGRDVCKELAQACARAKMPLGFYYSPPDMHHPGYRDTRKPATENWLGEPKRKQWAEYLDYMESHIRKLLTDYGDVSILWFDALVNHAKYDPERFHKVIHELSPNTLINDRLGDDYDYITPEQFIPKAGIPVKTGLPPSSNEAGGESFFRSMIFLDKIPGIHGMIANTLKKYGSGELELTPVAQETYPSPERFQPWETCMTMGRSWAYNPDENLWKDPRTLLHNLVRVVSRGGNYLLNVGPTCEGTFPPEAVERLQYISKWMNKYSDTIYGSTYTPLQAQSWGEITRKEDKIFLHICEWPSNGKLEIEGFPAKVNSVHFFSGETLEYSQASSHLEIALPGQGPDPAISVVEMEVDDSAEGWRRYSQPTPIETLRKKYIRTQAFTNAWLNSLINGVLAFFSYRARGPVPALEAAVDILITVFIIGFLVSWIAVPFARQQLAKENPKQPKPKTWNLKLPHGAALRGLVIAMAMTIGFGGILASLLTLASPGGFNHWVYFVIKTLYTGGCAAVTAVVTILTVFKEKKRV
jgi:alpha-L-fucosidase